MKNVKRFSVILIIAVMLISAIPMSAYAGVSGNIGGTKTRTYEVVLKENETSAEQVAADTDVAAYIAGKKSEFESLYNPLKTPEYDYGEENMTIADIDLLFTESSYAVVNDISNNTSYDISEDLIAIGDLDSWDRLQVAQGSIERTDTVTVKYDVVTVEKLPDDSDAEDEEQPAEEDNKSDAEDEEQPAEQDNKSDAEDEEQPAEQDNKSDAEDEEQPTENVIIPRTGDNTSILAFAALMILSAFGIAATIIYGKKEW